MHFYLYYYIMAFGSLMLFYEKWHQWCTECPKNKWDKWDIFWNSHNLISSSNIKYWKIWDVLENSTSMLILLIDNLAVGVVMAIPTDVPLFWDTLYRKQFYSFLFYFNIRSNVRAVSSSNISCSTNFLFFMPASF